jgi:hypothetical protein
MPQINRTTKRIFCSDITLNIFHFIQQKKALVK